MELELVLKTSITSLSDDEDLHGRLLFLATLLPLHSSSSSPAALIERLLWDLTPVVLKNLRLN